MRPADLTARGARRRPGQPPGHGREHRRHAMKVALAAAAVVAAFAALIGGALDVIVLRHLQSEADSRLGERLDAILASGPLDPAAARPLVHTTDGDGDYDDAPALVWLVAANGVATPLVRDAPALPVRRWRSGSTITLSLGAVRFRVAAQADQGGWLVAAESIGQLQRVRNQLAVTEVLLGGGLLVVVYAGALLVGLRASAPVEEVRRRQADFTADASHELRTPLSVIQAEVGLALERDRSAAYYRDTLGRVADEGVRLRAIVDDLLWLARSDAGSEIPPAGAVAVAAVAEETVSRFGAVASAQGTTLELAPSDLGVIVAPPGWVERLLGVLVDNACRYSGPGGRIVVEVATSGAHVVLTVDDDGPGIPVEERAAIFDRFHRASQLTGGTGLGLAIADSVVRTTGGEWHVGQAPLGGARFRVTWRAGAVASVRAAALAT